MRNGSNDASPKTALGDFVSTLQSLLTPESRVLYCQFHGSPEDDIKGKWRARVLRFPDQLDPSANVYLCVSAMRKNARGEFRRRKENFAGGLCLMIDDIGSGKAAKWPMSTIDALPPTAMIETSKDNFQAVYIFDAMAPLGKFNALISAFIREQFLTQDPGMAGVNRVFRPPVGINGKRKHGGWQVRCELWDPTARYSPDRIAEAYGLRLVEDTPRRRLPSVDKAEGVKAFMAVDAVLRGAGMIKRDRYDMGGWVDIVCPWTAHHTGRSDNGAALAMPGDENGWTGAFKCHHGSCKDRMYRDLTDWVANETAEVLEMINAAAPERMEK